MQYISSFPSESWQQTLPRSLCILGSTGSIGTSTLDVIRRQPEMFSVVALAGARNVELLAQQAAEFLPPYLGVYDEESCSALKQRLPSHYAPTILIGADGYAQLAQLAEVDTVVSAQVGAAGLRGTHAALMAGKVVALANKESLVLAGELIRTTCQEHGGVILPVDSEHNALFQCMIGQPAHSVSRIIITASGGPFFGKTREELSRVTLGAALAHPNWVMGAKITIDSSTLMNKGLEVIEAYHLYGMQLDEIDVVVHKESIIHSLVEYADGSQLAQLGMPDMRVAIAYAIGWPHRLHTGVKRLNLAELGSLSFATPDEEAFPCLALAKAALRVGNGATVVLNAANEVAVAAFLAKKIHYLDIARTVANCLEWHAGLPAQPALNTSIDAILDLDKTARIQAQLAVAAL